MSKAVLISHLRYALSGKTTLQAKFKRLITEFISFVVNFLLGKIRSIVPLNLLTLSIGSPASIISVFYSYPRKCITLPEPNVLSFGMSLIFFIVAPCSRFSNN